MTVLGLFEIALSKRRAEKKAAQLASLMRAAVIAGKISHLTFAFETFAFFAL